MRSVCHPKTLLFLRSHSTSDFDPMQNVVKSVPGENIIPTRPSYWCWFFPRDWGKDPWPTQCRLSAKIMVLKMQRLRTSLDDSSRWPEFWGLFGLISRKKPLHQYAYPG